MEKIVAKNLVVYILEDYEVGENKELAKEAMEYVRTSKEPAVYLECLGDARSAAIDFMSIGTTSEEYVSSGLVISPVESLTEIMDKIAFSVFDKNTKAMFLNFPDTYLEELPGIPQDYDFICLIMNAIITGAMKNISKTLLSATFHITVQRSAMKSKDVLDALVRS